MVAGKGAVHPIDVESVSTASPSSAAPSPFTDGEALSLECASPTGSNSTWTPTASMEATKSKQVNEFMHARSSSRFLRSAVTLNNLSSLDENARLCAVPPSLGVPRHTLLSAPLWLGPHINAAVLVAGVVLMAFVLMAPGAEMVEEHTACGRAGCTTPRFGLGLWLSICFVGLVQWILCACKMNRFIFIQLLMTFDFWVILVSWITKETVQVRNLQQTFEAYGKDLEWQIMDIVTRCFVALPLAISVGAIDSWQMPRWVKVVLASIVVLTLISQFSHHRFLADEWAEGKLESVSGDVSLRYIFLACHLQISLFIAKVLIAYLRGKLYAFYRPWYEVEEDIDWSDKPACYAVEVEKPTSTVSLEAAPPPPLQRQSTFTTIVVNVVSQPDIDIEAQQCTQSGSFKTTHRGTSDLESK